MPAAGVTARHIRAAGVRKPPGEETAHDGRDGAASSMGI
jgi:hypothetical protein